MWAAFERRFLANAPLWRDLTDRHRKRKAATPATREHIAALRGICRGQTCYILGTAPSLKERDLSPLNGKPCFSVNGGYDLSVLGLERLFGYVISDGQAFADYESLIDLAKIDHLFIRSERTINRPDLAEKAVIYDAIKKPRAYKGFIQTRLEDGVYTGHTVALDAIQIAAHMGFTKIVLLGIDLKFDPADLHFYRSNQREARHGHAHSVRYAGKMLKSIETARRLLLKEGIELLNGGRRDCLPMLPWIDIDSGKGSL